MQKLDEYITSERITDYLCRIRAKLAKQRSKKHLLHLLSSNDEYNYHLNSQIQKDNVDKDLLLLNTLLPSRRKWKKLNKLNRYNRDNQQINSIEYNVKSLLLTIEYYRKKFPNEAFLMNLDAFIENLKFSINNPLYKIEEPTIIPKLKGDKNPEINKCRPISQFSLKDRLIISFTNKYFTELFDSYFYSRSFAFRAIQEINGEKIRLTHHDAIQEILDYKKKFKGKKLWVAECDICKFYDSVHHTIVKEQFQKIIKKVKKEKPAEYDIRAERIFYKYLDSYTFVKNVLPLNNKTNESYWKEKYKIPGGHFGWVEKELMESGYFRNIKKSKIGVPQGGAISGLIANLVLNYSDNQILKGTPTNLLYVRFCDDMVLIHPSKKECIKASHIYSESLKKLHLIPHEFQENLKNTANSFWSDKIKSKSTYKWSSNYPDSFKWFGFVGYEIHYNGDLRVRKSSLLKEKTKQKKVVTNIIGAIKNGKRKNDGTIVESAKNRLIGMSVGRVSMKNYKSIDNDLCWVNGFKKLSDNPQLRLQMKDLDRSRAKQISKLINKVKVISSEKIKFTRIKIKKNAFCTISGISEKVSIEILNLLVSNNVLNSKFVLNNLIDFKNPTLNLGLTEDYMKYNNEILNILMNPLKKRDVAYYGKPFSYYYHIIEKKKLFPI